MNGDIRVSKTEQNQDQQFDSFNKAGCKKIFQKKISGTFTQRQEYLKMISELRKGDGIVFWRIDSTGRPESW
ncbi:recombinase family protein [Dyadobacter luteus]|uniref:recombinase family protein n=1 Tax=Dyadobacter luteus TaxID=2259619 RepID=UPI001314FF8E